MILASIKPYYYYLIAEWIKKIEVRKSALKNLPQDIAFYMSKDEKSFAKIPKVFQEKYRKHFGKVGMRVVCDKVEKFDVPYPAWDKGYLNDILKNSCLTYNDLHSYIGSGNRGYGWHISDLKIYDKPKELSEFNRPCSYAGLCFSCDRAKFTSKGDRICQAMITRPPQSYMFVEEIETK